MRSADVLTAAKKQKIYDLSMKYSPEVFRIVEEFFKLDFTEQVLANLRKRLDDYFEYVHLETALQHGVTKNSLVLIELLTLINTDLNAGNFIGDTPLISAIRMGHVSIVKYLLDHDVDINVPNKKRITPLQSALILGRTDIVKELLSKRYNNVIFIKDIDVVKFLLDKEDEVIIPGINFSTLLYFSVGISDDALKLALSNSSISYVNAMGPGNESLLRILIKNGNKNMINYLLDYGVDFNVQGTIYTPFLYAMDHNKSMVPFLLEKGFNVKIRPTCGLPPIYLSILFCNVGILKLLVKYGADVNSKTHQGKTCLHFALEMSGKKVVDKLLELKADINTVDDELKLTPLESAVIDWKWMKFSNHSRGINSLLATIAQMKFDKDYVSERNIKCIEKNADFRMYYNKCENEIRRMIKKRISVSSKVCVYDFLTNDLQKLTSLARNKFLIKILKGQIYEFPIYCDRLKKNIERAEWRLKRIERSVKLFKDDVDCKLPPLMFDKICGYLSDDDLQNLMHYLRNK